MFTVSSFNCFTYEYLTFHTSSAQVMGNVSEITYLLTKKIECVVPLQQVL